MSLSEKILFPGHLVCCEDLTINNLEALTMKPFYQGKIKWIA